jgi:hypothetical protein
MIEELLAIFAAIPGPPDDPQTLYDKCYSHSVLASWSAAEPGDLAAVNSTVAAFDDGWQAESAAPDGFIVARKSGAARLFHPGQYLTLRGPGVKIDAGEPIRVIAPAGAADIQPSFYHCFGETVSEHDEMEDLVRFYWNVSGDGAAPLVALVTGGLNRFGVPFRFKVGQHAGVFTRRDPAVLYVHRSLCRFTARLVRRIHAAAGSWMREGTPLFTRPIARGLAFAEDPGGSFGKDRCTILSECMVATRDLPPPERLEDLRRRFAAHGLTLDQAWLNPGSVDYEL